MKFAAYIVALLLLVLPCIPVNAGIACCHERLEESYDENDGPDCDHSENNKKQHTAACSCCSSYFCSNCNFVSIHDFSLEIFGIAPMVDRPQAMVIENVPTAHLSSFWQPPRI